MLCQQNPLGRASGKAVVFWYGVFLLLSFALTPPPGLEQEAVACLQMAEGALLIEVIAGQSSEVKLPGLGSHSVQPGLTTRKGVFPYPQPDSTLRI